MGVYKRGKIYWIRYAGPDGEIERESTKQTDRRIAERMLGQRRQQVRDGNLSKGPIERPTVQSYGELFIARQWEKGLESARDIESRLRKHAFPLIGTMPLDQIRPKDCIALVEGLKRKMRDGELAPRSVRHVYDHFKALCRDAVIDEHIPANPARELPPKTLPPKKDKDPKWRPRAKFTRAEIEQLVSDERIPHDRRVLYALIFFTGSRFGEASGRRWRDWDPDVQPLGRMVVDSQYDDAALKSPDDDAPPREVPVHPTFAAILAEWRLQWERWFLRQPKPDDFIVPTRPGNPRAMMCRAESSGWSAWRDDLARIELRHRRRHDLRRTFISLCRDDGARRDVLQAITHGQKGDVFDDYTSWDWKTLCEEVLKLRIQRRKPVAVRALKVSDAED